MSIISKDFLGMVCPLPVISTIKLVNQMSKGDTIEVLIDDPLAVKSIPDELEDFDIEINVKKIESNWKITIEKK